MPVPAAITDLSQTANSNSPSGSESPITADNYFRSHASFIALLSAALGNSTTAGFLQTGTGATARTFKSRLLDSVSVKDFGAVGDGTTGDTAAIQAAIDSLTSGGEVYFPPGVYDVTGLRIDGSSGGLTNITLRGAGSASEIRITASNTSNVIRSVAGSGFRISNLRIRGGLGRSVTAVAAPSRGLWVTGTAYTAGDTVEVSSSDAATTSIVASNLVYECTGNHTAGATFAGDKATYWTASAVANLNTVDISYGTRNNIYLDGVTNASVDSCELLDSVYAGVNVGTGPVQTANAGTGSSYVRVTNCYFSNCTNGIAGGKMTYCSFDANTMKDCVTYGIVIDDPASTSNSITDNVIYSPGSHAIYLYGADVTSVSGNTINGATGVGILLDSAAVGNSIVGNAITGCQQGIRAYNSTIGSIVGNTCRLNSQYGIFIEIATQVALSGNTCESNTFDGIRLTTVSGFAANGNVCSTNDGEGGLYLTGCSNGSVNGGTYLNNNDGASPSSTGAGIRLIDSSSINISGARCYDSRSGGSKTQKYGIHSTGTSDSILLGVNSLAGNATGTFLLAGTANRVSPDFADYSNAATPANFTADKYVTFVDSDGTTVYIPARLGSW